MIINAPNVPKFINWLRNKAVDLSEADDEFSKGLKAAYLMVHEMATMMLVDGIDETEEMLISVGGQSVTKVSQ